MKSGKRITRRLFAVALLVGVGAVALAVSPRGRRLEWYTSPPLTIRGKTARLRALVPSGWVASAPRIVPWSNLEPGPDKAFVRVNLTPRKVRWWTHWVPEVIRRTLLGPDEWGASVSFVYGASVSYSAGKVIAGNVMYADDFWEASISLDKPVDCEIQYYRSDHAAFEATYRQICESFRVIQ